MKYHYYTASLSELPDDWDEIVAQENRLLSKEYFLGLEASLPSNMKLSYIVFKKGDELVGGALIQRLFLSNHVTFNPGNSKLCFLRNWIIKGIANEVSFVGNNMLTGQNGFYFDLKRMPQKDTINLLLQGAELAFQDFPKNKLVILKDYNQAILDLITSPKRNEYSPFEVQPTMIMPIRGRWKSFEDYYQSMKKKYRARVRTARKKLQGIEKRELTLEDLQLYEKTMYELYKNVANNAVFNTFYLAENHFIELKRHLGKHFRVYGCFKEEELVCFHSIIDNYTELDTYFLGYKNELQKNNQLYLNMLLDMVEEGIEMDVIKINFGRTAIEIKSTIGAVPQNLFGLMRLRNKYLNKLLPKLFKRINPDTDFVIRSPFD